MAKKIFLTDIDLTQNELQNGVIQNLATAPTSPKPGQLYYNTSSNRPYFWDSSTWSLFGHSDTEINSLVRGTLLSGYTKGANSALAASDSVLSAFGKIQGQIDAIPRGTVTSVGLSAPVGLTVTGSPITGSGTLALSLTSGYSIPTTAKQGQWDIAYTNNHTHANKALIDGITQGNIDVLSKLSIDANGNLKIDTNAYSTGELSAYGAGTGGGSGSSYERLDSWADYAAGKEGWVLSALLGKDLDTRVSLLEGGSATTVTTTGTGNAITKIEKAGATITATKGLTFAELDASGKVLASQLPSYVDDVIEAANLAGFPATGETGKIYIARDTNKTYRWSGTAYVEISASLALGTTSSTAFRGDYGNTAYTHSQSEHQSIINGTGFVKANGKTLSYDNSSYSLSNHNHSGIYEPVFTKNSAFNKNFGTTAGTVAQGNDSRFTNSRTPTKKTGTISAALTTSVTHGLGSADVIAQVMTIAGEVVECNIVNTSTTTTFSFNVAPAANTYKYVIIG